MSEFKPVSTVDKEGSVESDLQRILLDVYESTSEEEVLEKFRQAKADLLEKRRQQILWNATMIISHYNKEVGLTHESVPPLSELRSRLEMLPPKQIQERIKDLQTELENYQNFERDLFEPKLWEQRPFNWEDEAATKEEYVALLKERNRDYLETIKAAVPYLKEIIEVHRNVLNEKVASLKMHEPEVPGLVKECTQLAKEAGVMKRKAMELLRKLERSSLSKKDKAKVEEKILALIRRHQQLEAQRGLAYENLAAYTVDKPEVRASIPGFESSRYNLPLWLQIKLERATRP